MRTVIQRVQRASISVEGVLISEIGAGLMVLLGIKTDDTEAKADKIADKIRALRIFDDSDGMMNEPIGKNREILCISQFTLYGDTKKGNRPSYITAARPEEAEPLYERVCDRLEAKRGVFGANMQVELVNDGPVTVTIEI